jgi:hypothetical protein
MTDPWEIPPCPAHGDRSEKDTHNYRSRALDAWERVELALYMLDGVFCQAVGIMSQYGKGIIFRNRFKFLEAAAESYFIKYPNQEIEAEFSVLSCHLLKYSLRRHDIAHGIVFIYSTMKNRQCIEFALLPAFYTVDRPRDTENFPNYAYDSVILGNFYQKFSDLEERIKSFTYRLRPPSL